MASHWFCTILGEELGPLTFGELVELVRAGTLGPEDLVRRADLKDWQPADSVIGLFHTARTVPPAERHTRDSAQPAESPAAPREEAPEEDEVRQGLGKAAWIGIAAAAVVLLPSGLGTASGA